MLGPHPGQHLLVVFSQLTIPPDLLIALKDIGHHVAHGHQKLFIQHQPPHLGEALHVQVVVQLHLGRSQNHVGLLGGHLVPALLGILSRPLFGPPGAFFFISPWFGIPVLIPDHCGAICPVLYPAPATIPEVGPVVRAGLVHRPTALDPIGSDQPVGVDLHPVGACKRNEVAHRVIPFLYAMFNDWILLYTFLVISTVGALLNCQRVS